MVPYIYLHRLSAIVTIKLINQYPFYRVGLCKSIMSDSATAISDLSFGVNKSIVHTCVSVVS